MVNIDYITDIHLDCRGTIKGDIPPQPGKILLIAGDTCEVNSLKNPGMIAQMEKICAAYDHVYAICGNHEFYGTFIETGVDVYRKYVKHIPNFTVLDNEVVDLGDYLLVATTLWTDFNKEDPQVMWVCGRMMNDYVYIFQNADMDYDGPKKAIKPYNTAELHKQAVAFLENALENANKPVIVMTHHAPLMAHCNDQRRGAGYDLVNFAYATDLPEFVANPKIAAWIHGHTHDEKVTWFEGTPLQTFARGYYRDDFTVANLKVRGEV